MPHYLCISVTFLDSLFHGKCDREPEWPPSPMRLFQALLAGELTSCRGRDWNESKTKAFEWLQGQKPPRIFAPAAALAAPYALFVPNNDADRKFERQNRLTTKVLHPHRLCDGSTLHYLWSFDEQDVASQACAQTLCMSARHLAALGWGIDQAVANGQIIDESAVAELAEDAPECWEASQAHRPSRGGLRVPQDGTLADLERVHRSFRDRVSGRGYEPPLSVRCFDTVEFLRRTAIPSRSYAVFELSEGFAFRQVDTNKVASMLRSVACKHAQSDTHEFRIGDRVIDSAVYVAGHVTGNETTPPRFSYLPLPTIGGPHADGMIRRLLVAEPFGGDGGHARWVQQRLLGVPLMEEGTGTECGLLLESWRKSTESMIRRYAKASRNWSTVTPVILPGHDSGKRKKAYRLFRAALSHAGIPDEAVVDFELHKTPVWPGSHHAHQYHRPNHMKHGGRWHVRLRFSEPVAGPLAIGAGRHRGLGLFAAEA